MKPTCHSGAGRNPDEKNILAERDNGFCRCAVVLYCWIPACAGMTGLLHASSLSRVSRTRNAASRLIAAATEI